MSINVAFDAKRIGKIPSLGGNAVEVNVGIGSGVAVGADVGDSKPERAVGVTGISAVSVKIWVDNSVGVGATADGVSIST